MKVIQVMNALDRADAVSQHLLELDRMLRDLGHETDIYSQFVHTELAGRRRPARELRHASGDVLLFHYAGFSPLLGVVSRFPGRRGVVFHNVTPPELFPERSGPRNFCEKGLAQIPTLARVFDFALPVSEFNARDLEAAGFDATRVLPISWETSGVASTAPHPGTLRRYADSTPNLLVVGRVAPSKGILHAVRALPLVEQRAGERVRLLVVGKTRDYEPYVRELRKEARRLRVNDRVVITGEVDTAKLAAFYRQARALLVLSDHEGFSVPIVEARALGVPVVAYDAGAVAETLGDGGILLKSREPEAVADSVARVLGDGPERALLLERQRVSNERFAPETVRATLAKHLAWAVERPRPVAPAPQLPSFSIVVCTYNRAGVLGDCLKALGRLDYPDYEIVVVNGPSTDNTSDVLSRFPGIKRIDNPVRNLSVSRNLGIAASAGEIVAFIDDDAVPAPDWLDALADAYVDPMVGAAGGKVYGPGGDHLQFDNGIISRWGLPTAVQDEPDDRNAPGGECFNILMGTNSSFRRRVLQGIGGFDENYEYYHDESDLCVRVIRAGYCVQHVPEATVWHEFEKSHVRKSLKNVNWTVVTKNTVYFYFCNNRWHRRPWDWFQPLRACLVHLGIFTRWFVRGGLPPGTFVRSLLRWIAGTCAGYLKGWFRKPRRRLAARRDERADHFLRYAASASLVGKRALRLALVSQQYPPDACGGIGVYTERLARGLVEAGHRVTVIAKGSRESILWRDGVKVHRVPNEGPPRGIPFHYRVTRKNVGRSLAVDRVIHRLFTEEGLDLAEAPLWDAEGLAPSVSRRVPLVLRIETPMALAIETQGWQRNEDFDLACEMEWASLRNAQGVVDASGTILRTIEERFGVHAAGAVVREIPYGVPLPGVPAAPRGDRVRILFLGRLERRKGIDLLVAAMPRVLRECPDVEIDVAGSFVDGQGPRDFLGGLEPALARRVRFHGRVDDATQADLYAGCDIFAGPSRYESFGIVFVEAMSYGKPVVACDVGGATRIVRNEENGVLVSPESSAALAEALVRLAKDRDLRERLGRAGRETAERDYSIEAMVRRTIELYEELL